jgi:hypothetical protein
MGKRLKHKIEVKSNDGILSKTVYRVLRAEMIGNFNPIFCTYNGKKYLVQSEYGDLSDPFRREEHWFGKLFIKLEVDP